MRMNISGSDNIRHSRKGSTADTNNTWAHAELPGEYLKKIVTIRPSSPHPRGYFTLYSKTTAHTSGRTSPSTAPVTQARSPNPWPRPPQPPDMAVNSVATALSLWTEHMLWSSGCVHVSRRTTTTPSSDSASRFRVEQKHKNNIRGT